MSGTQIQINQLPAVTTPGSGDAIPVQQAADGVTRYATAAQILAAAGGATSLALSAETSRAEAAEAANASAAAAAQATANAAEAAISAETSRAEAAEAANASAAAAAQATANAAEAAISAETSRAEAAEAANASAAAAAQATANAAEAAISAETSRAEAAEAANASAAAAAQATANAAEAAISAETSRAEAAEAANASAAAAAQATANAAQPAIAPNAGKVLTGPSTLGGDPGTLNVGGPAGLVQADSSGNISAQTVLATGTTSARSLAALASGVAALQIATIADLRAWTSATATTASVSGYAAAADGGGGIFVVDATDTTSADNGGTIIVDAAGRRWYRQTNGIIRPEHFGVQTDTTGALVAANSAAYNKAIAAASASATSRLYHSAGLTVFLNPIVLTAAIFWEIDGKITLAANSNAHIVDLQASNIAIWGNGTLNGNKANQQGGVGTVVGGICSNTNSTSATMPLPPASPISISNILIRGITITEVFNWPVSLGYVTNGTIDGVTMNYSGSSPQYIFSGNNCWIYNSTIHDITDGGFVFYQGQQNFGAIGNSVYNCYDGIGVFCDNSTESADYFGMIANNLVYSNRDSGIGITTGGTSPSLNQSYIHVTGNTLRNNNNGGRYGIGSIGVVGAQAVAIKGNFIANDGASAASGNTSYSVTVDSASKFITIEDNVIGNVGSAAAPGIAIWTTGANYLAVKGNRFFDVNGTPTTYGIGGNVGATNVFENNVAMGPIKALFYLFTPAADTLINNQVTPQGAYGFSPLIQVMPPASTGNGIEIASEAPGNTPVISAVGSDTDISIDLIPKGNGIVFTTASVVGGNFALQATGITWTGGAGTPTGTQPKGSLFTRTDGGIGTTLYVSQGGGTWNAVAGV